MKERSGIYIINVGRHFYIGQTTNLQQRKAQHKYNLAHGVHHNKELQEAYDKCGRYKFSVIAQLPGNELAYTEAKIINSHHKDPYCVNNYNSGKVFIFVNRDLNLKEVCTQHELADKYSLNYKRIHDISTGYNLTHKGWEVEKEITV